MKKLLFLATLAFLAVGCDDDSASNGGENTDLIAPALYMDVVTSDGPVYRGDVYLLRQLCQ